MKRKRSVKISNVALEPVQWQNDSLQIITSASDLKSMDEFLLKKVTPVLTAPAKSSESSMSRWRQQSQNDRGGSSSSADNSPKGVAHALGSHSALARQLQSFHCFELPLVALDVGDLGGQELKAVGQCSCWWEKPPCNRC